MSIFYYVALTIVCCRGHDTLSDFIFLDFISPHGRILRFVITRPVKIEFADLII